MPLANTTTKPILLVDDDLEDCEMMEQSLRRCNIPNPVASLHNGVALLEHLENAVEQPPCLIFLDLNMPKMNGHEALAHLRKDARFKHIPVIVMTTSNTEEDIVTTYAHGANSYITKPVSLSGLDAVMDTLTKYWFKISSLPDISQHHSPRAMYD